ncbi:GGDEF domain-containing protein [Clostridium estertheticum]|uniref:GGDEF domain-containing protein n=1 Tax=Clostridium estertheticum TaxID=238834 RepID=UPI0013E969E6|nr:GGDEF domain-containing protein [Clostridium estertheticum]MBZ9687186.1 GGDEF domain-containing protein [Clostridium estertheticum]
MIQFRKIIVFLFVLVLLFYMIKLLILTKRSWKFGTYTFAVLIGGLSLLTIGTFLDMIVYIKNYEFIYILIKIFFTLGAIIYVLGVILWSNYTQKMINQFEKTALTDSMTGLLNRNGIEKIFNMRVKARISFYVIVCDLDGTKKINDSLGHLVGDKYIKSTTKIMTDIIGSKGNIARIGGDEFVIFLEYIDIQELQLIILNMKQAIYGILPEKNTGISVGYSLFLKDGVTFEELIKIADEKMYKDKQSRKQCG